MLSVEDQWQVHIQWQSARTTWHRGVARKPFRQKYSDDPMRPAKSDEVSAQLIRVLARSLSGPCVNETPPEKGIVFPFYLNSPSSHFFPTLLIPPVNTPKCPPSPALSVPLPLGPLPRSPLLPFARLRPLSVSRGEPGPSPRALSVSTQHPQMLFRAAWKASRHIATSKYAFNGSKCALRSSMMSRIANRISIRDYSPAEEVHRVTRMD